LLIGVHVSIAGSIDLSVLRAKEAGCNTFQIFTRNPRGWSFSPLQEAIAGVFRENLNRNRIWPPVAHMPYLPNLASPKDDIYRRSVETLLSEIKRCDLLGIPFLVTHLGSHLGFGEEEGRRRIVSAIDRALELDCKCMILLENTAGQKNSLGSDVDAICAILSSSSAPDRLGLCLDTCHAFAAGYDVRSRFSALLDEVDRSIGIGKLKVIHMNDCKGDLGSHLDRHEHIGLGKIGESGFRSILSDKRIRDLPLIMETPIDSRRDDRGNIAKLRELAQEVGSAQHGPSRN